MVRSKNRLRWCVVLIVCNIAFIWGNSMLPAEISRAVSGFVRDVVSIFFGGKGDGEAVFGEGILRKTAHFIEFTCLGVWLCWLFSMLRKHWLFALGCGFLTACVDETIQCFVPGRGPRVTDVLLDSAGIACGIGLLIAVYTIYRNKKNNKLEEK